MVSQTMNIPGIPTVPELEQQGEKLEDRLIAGLRAILEEYEVSIQFKKKEPPK